MSPRDLNPPRQLRIALYVAIMVGGPLMIYFNNTGRIGPEEMKLWIGLCSVIALMAGLNITPDRDELP